MRPDNARQLERLKARLATVPIAVREAVKPTLSASGDMLAAEMRRLAPVESGELRDSIASGPGKLENQFTVRASAPYAVHVEFGTSKMEAQPFFFPAYRSLRDKIMGDLKRAVVVAVKQKGDGK